MCSAVLDWLGYLSRISSCVVKSINVSVNGPIRRPRSFKLHTGLKIWRAVVSVTQGSWNDRTGSIIWCQFFFSIQNCVWNGAFECYCRKPCDRLALHFQFRRAVRDHTWMKEGKNTRWMCSNFVFQRISFNETKQSQQLHSRADADSLLWAKKNEVVYFHRYRAVIPVNPWHYFYVAKLQWSWGTSVGETPKLWLGPRFSLKQETLPISDLRWLSDKRTRTFSMILGNLLDVDEVCSGMNNLEDVIALGGLSANGGLEKKQTESWTTGNINGYIFFFLPFPAVTLWRFTPSPHSCHCRRDYREVWWFLVLNQPLLAGRAHWHLWMGSFSPRKQSKQTLVVFPSIYLLFSTNSG